MFWWLKCPLEIKWGELWRKQFFAWMVFFLDCQERSWFIFFHNGFVKDGFIKIWCGTHSMSYVHSGKRRGTGHLDYTSA